MRRRYKEFFSKVMLTLGDRTIVAGAAAQNGVVFTHVADNTDLKQGRRRRQ